ncbi:inorganic pyrophosphatase [Mycoplasma flocculare]|uniref:Inorganic pyrophosphatase n=2 Tax=Mesomycoplasma flocculare TaxID=2128 RepID=A0A0A8E809_MESFC|nr:inorganic diphosphatase [Mesomycoplasma flocculare]MXR39569.1 inorganic pyrophosphatase [Mycoplasma sp. MF12]AJC50069.1 inorganic pyrophosphatase [Mesomycoplasma flocculare ATCC 27399]ENX51035.1 inorganic pyrophosphatase [Mesomycoplasma flocculare ATCC 27716]MXR05949.1 inorganic pyrophosphatase [Mesomycoplasma flocculare]MXR23033.1 inorganic pyrophosphatase [Mesomycoplasma flocculare]
MDKKIILVDIEISKGSNIKYELDHRTKKLVVDRILYGDFVYPANYGSIPQTLDWDGDALDILVYSNQKFLPGSQLNARLLGSLEMIDDGEIDTKLIGVHNDDYRFEHINSLDDLPREWLDSIHYFFSNYKNWKKPGITKVSKFINLKETLKEYQTCQKLYSEYKNLEKSEFLKIMQKKFPEKYQ